MRATTVCCGMLAALVLACGGPSIDDGAVACGPDQLCPSGFTCAADNRCYRGGGGPTTDAPGNDNCGNGVVELGETCDPMDLCPDTCDDTNACTADVQLGMAQTCNVTCLHDTVTECADGDDCCPASCDSDSDDDCSATCGNDTLEEGETCDPPASCPTTCNDGNACTTDQTLGSAQNCNVTCSHATVSGCNDGDGCCPAGCNTNNDGDCSASCGNGTVESGETCDPPSSCPSSCTDGNACTLDSLTGSATNCNVACTFTPIVSCKNGDGCCPAGCSALNDNNCSATCGNGAIETGETCDPPSSCPTSCGDGNECTIDTKTGSAATCNVACSHTPIVSCGDDGCCPAGCDAVDDADCSPSCGNRVIETGETCDPPSSCPSSCDDGNACTSDTRTGNSSNCNVRCSHSTITACVSADGCCPVACVGMDTDCNDSSCGDGFCDGPAETASNCAEDCLPRDAGPRDAGPRDAGPRDAGPRDAAPTGPPDSAAPIPGDDGGVSAARAR